MFCMPNQKCGVKTNVALSGVGFLQTQSVQKCLVLCIINQKYAEYTKYALEQNIVHILHILPGA